MASPKDVVMLAAVAFAAIACFAKSQEIRDAIEKFVDRFGPRGGPPTPMHPSPADDDSLLRPNRRSVHQKFG